jgi:hypothetical protein
MKAIIREYLQLSIFYWKIEKDGISLHHGKAETIEKAISNIEEISKSHSCIIPLNATVREYQIDLI